MFDANGAIYSSSGDGFIHKWMSADQRWEEKRFSESGSYVSILADPSGRYLLTTDEGNQNNIRLWDWESKIRGGG